MAGGTAYATRSAWKPPVRRAAEPVEGHEEAGEHTHEGEHTGEHADEHAGEAAGEHADEHADEHAGEAGAPAPSITLSPQAQRNIDLEVITAEIRPWDRTITVPAIVVERPGQTEMAVSAPMTGIVTQVHALAGSAVTPGETLFELRLTHEDLVDKQTQFLVDLEQLDVVKLEIARLEDVTRSGAVAGKALLERQYEGQRLEAALRADREALLLHGLSEEQIATIVETRRLQRTMTVTVPSPPAGSQADHAHDALFQVTDVAVRPGDHVQVGTLLATLSDHCELYVEGKAFEEDATSLVQAAREGREVTALFEGTGPERQPQGGLKILYVEDRVDRQSRALQFFVRLPNTRVRNETAPDGRRFVSWKYRPGQRVELLIPVERWNDSLVVPVAAVVDEGAETYVYRQAGDRFDRVTVHVQYRDPQSAVLEADGTVSAGDRIAGRGAYAIHLAIKNQSGGGVDPHAGHNH